MRARLLVLPMLCLTAGCDPSVSYGGGVHPDLFGRVTIDGQAAGGLTVVATNSWGTYRATTDGNGKYYFLQVPYDKTALRVEAPEFVLFNPAADTVILDGTEKEKNFAGYSPRSVVAEVVWEYANDRKIGIAGVDARMFDPPFAVPSVVTGADGSYRFPRAPALGEFPVTLGTLPAGLRYFAGRDTWIYRNVASASGMANTTRTVYVPSAELRVDVFVDGAPYPAVVHLDTPLPVTDAPGSFRNLPVRTLAVSISGFPSSITFDATTKLVQLQDTEAQTVVFTGFTPGANRPPTVTLIAPANNATFNVGTPITFRGSAQDIEDGMLTGDALDWYRPGVGPLGRGETFTTDTLPIGRHRIVFRATDSGRSTAQAFVDVNIVPLTGGRVLGRVTIDGSPIVGMRVDLSTAPVRFAVTDAQGSYVFDDVPAGPRTVTIQSVSCVDFPELQRTITVAVGQTTMADFSGRERTYCYDGGGGGGTGWVRPPR